MPDSLDRWEGVMNDLRAHAQRARWSADQIEMNDGKDKGYGVKIGEACAFQIAADRIAREISELRYNAPNEMLPRRAERPGADTEGGFDASSG